VSEPTPLPETTCAKPADPPLDAGLTAAFVPDSLSTASRNVPISLRDLESENSYSVHPPAQEPFATGTAGRNLLFAEIGHGGMGAVFHGRDPALGRDLAVKVLLEAHRDKPELVQRFLEEAQIAGQLQHPGVVPVYELGQCDDHRPFFTMKLVKGQTLADLLRKRPAPQDDLPRFLTIFEQVCQTVAYAHARRVIHRDLKPSNVMVGNFGEVQVMDWGMAKVLERNVAGEASRDPQPPEEATVIKTARSGSGAEMSLAGTVLGTPAFMPPEQARGEVDRLDERADVFGLGAMLCVILTGQPPYLGRDSAEMHGKALLGDLTDALVRLDGCGADAELIQLCKDCLAPERDERPRTAGKVAQRLAAYQAGVQKRLRDAELDRAAAQAKAVEERKRRKLAMTLQRQAAERRTEVGAALERAADLRSRARWSEAQLVLDHARARLGSAGPEELRQRLEQTQADLLLVARLDDIRQKRSAVVEGRLDNAKVCRDYAAAFRDAGLGQVGDDEPTVAQRISDSAIKEPLVAALDDWAGLAEELLDKAWLLGVACRADPSPWRDRFCDPAIRRDRPALEQLAREADMRKLSPHALVALGRALRLVQADAIPLLTAAQARYPGDFWLNLDLGNALSDARKAAEAVGYYRVAVALQADSRAAHNNLGVALKDLGRLDEAIREYRAALALDPKFARGHNNLGVGLWEKGELDEAIQEYRAALVLDPRFARAHNNLGVALKDQGQLDEAIRAYRAALTLDPQFAVAHYNLGVVLKEKGQLDEAIGAYRAALTHDPQYAVAHYHLGSALKDKGQLDEAIQAYRATLTLDPKFAPAHNGLGLALKDKGQLDEAIREYRAALSRDSRDAAAHYNLGNALSSKGQLAEAIGEYRAALALNPKYAVAHYNLGNALRDKGELDEAIEAYRAACALDPRHVRAHNNLGLILHDKGQLDEAIAAYRAALALDPKYAVAHNNLGVALKDKGQLDEAIAAYRAALVLAPRFARAHYNLGSALRDQGQLNEAIQEYRATLALNPKFAEAYCCLGQVLRRKGKFAESLEAYRKGHELGSGQAGWLYTTAEWVHDAERLVELERRLPAILEGKGLPANNAERLMLARMCLEHKHLPVAAVRFYEEAAAADAQLADHPSAGHRYNAACAAALAGGGQGKDAGILSERERLRLSKRALDWLRADLALWTQHAELDDAKARDAVQHFKRWQTDPVLAGLRDKDALVKLPEAERDKCRKFWDDVAALLTKFEAKKD
jgi:serine/threonine-protein kinase